MSAVAEKKLAPANVRDQVSAEEWQVRVDLAAAYRLVAEFGWEDLIYTHISVRVPGPEHHFLINPYGMLFDEITASSLVKIDLDGRIVMPSDYNVNPAGFTIHSAIHAAREDAKAVLHLHTREGMAVSAHAKGLLPLNQSAMLLQPHLAYHDYEGVALDHDERPRLVADLGDKCAYILRNHGLLTVGETVADAFVTMHFLQRACEAQVMTLGASQDINWPSEASIRTTREQAGAMKGIGKYSWPGLLRRLDRKDTSYRN